MLLWYYFRVDVYIRTCSLKQNLLFFLRFKKININHRIGPNKIISAPSSTYNQTLKYIINTKLQYAEITRTEITGFIRTE